MNEPAPLRVRTEATAQVVAFPPLVVAGPLVAGLVLERLVPLGRLPTGVRWPGAALVVAGALLVGWSVATLRRHRTAVNPFRPTRELVTGGPFAWSRNPIYLGFGLAYVGLGLAARSGWVLGLFPLVAAVLAIGVVRREERYLRGLFGAAYEGYCARVRRWV